MRRRDWIAWVVLTALTLALFSWSVRLRAPWFGTLSHEHHQWITATTSKFAENWRMEGALRLRFAMLEFPPSIELPTVAARQPYVSYPPGCVLPVYLASFFTRAAFHRMAMAVNLVEQLLVAWLLCAAVWRVLRRSGVPTVAAAVFAATVPALAIFLPGPMYFEQQTFFADTAVLAPVALAVLIEISLAERRGATRAWLEVFSFVVTLYGLLTDWLFVFVWMGLAVHRWCMARDESRTRRSLPFLAAAVLASGAFVYEVLSVGHLASLEETFLMRIGANSLDRGYAHQFVHNFWGEWMVECFGAQGRALAIGSVIFLVGLAVFMWRANRLGHRNPSLSGPFALMSLLVIPVMLQPLALRNHSSVHDFSAVKFALVIAVIPFALAPASVMLALDARRPFRRRERSYLAVSLICALAATLVLVRVAPGYKRLFPAPSEDLAQLQTAIRPVVHFEDVVFSPDFDGPANPPQVVYAARKPIHRVASFDEVTAYMHGVDPKARMVLLFRDAPTGAWTEHLRDFARVPTTALFLYRQRSAAAPVAAARPE